MEGFLSFVLVVFGILQIILFFKLWGMTNDVVEIKKYLLSKGEDSSSLNRVKDLVKNGQKAEAEEALENVAGKLVSDIMNQKLSVEVAKERFAALEAQYKALGKTMPDYIASVKDML